MLTFLEPISDPEIRDQLGLGGAAHADDLIFTGSMAVDMATLTNVAANDSIEAETRYCFDKIVITLERAGCTLADIAKINCYATELDFAAEMFRTIDDIFGGNPTPKLLLLKGGIGAQCRLEFEVLAIEPTEESWIIASPSTIQPNPNKEGNER